MITIHLHNVKFHCFHGIHEEERLLGNDYEVNADVQFHEEHSHINSLSQTINYVELFEIIKARMEIPTDLLETIVMDIGNSIHENHNYVRSIHIFLKKINPPVAYMQGSAAVSWHKEF